MKSLNNLGMRQKFLVILGISFFMIGLFLYLYFPLKQKSDLTNSLREKSKILAQMVANTAGVAFVFDDASSVTSQLEAFKQMNDVKFAMVLKKDGSKFAAYNESKYSEYNLIIKELINSKSEYSDESNDVLLVYPVISNNENVGTVVIGMSKDEINSIISSARITAFVISLVIFLFGLIGIRIFFNRIVYKPIKELSVAAAKISSGDLTVFLENSSMDDVGDLSRQFNTMVKNLQTLNNQLNEEKLSIQKKVEEAVEESENQKKYLTSSVNIILEEMEKFAEGDLTVSLNVEKNDEIGKLFEGFNKAVGNVGSLLSQVNEAVQATASASNEISSSSEEMAAGAQEQSTQTAEVACAVEEMTRTILGTTKNSSTAAEAAKNSGVIAKEGGRVVSETIEGMNRVAEVVKKSAATVQALGKSSDQIGEIVQVIDDIADQTNLLALNAAIEAARAGEQGRGFAVVADEVRKLAERTTKATKEIAMMIRQIQKDTEGAVVSMKLGTEEVEKGKVLADKAGHSLQQIITGAEEVVDMVTQVAATSEEQSSAAEQISKNIESISNVTQESAAGVQQIARASEDLNRLTLNLQELIAKFKIEDRSSNTLNANKKTHQKSNLSVRSNGAIIKS